MDNSVVCIVDKMNSQHHTKNVQDVVRSLKLEKMLVSVEYTGYT